MTKKTIFILKEEWHDGDDPKNIRGYRSWDAGVKGIQKRARKQMRELRKRENGQDYFLTELFNPKNNQFKAVCIFHTKSTAHIDDAYEKDIPQLDRQPYQWKNVAQLSMVEYYLEQLSFCGKIK